jgi:hypothetical protein
VKVYISRFCPGSLARVEVAGRNRGLDAVVTTSVQWKCPPLLSVITTCISHDLR